MVPGIEPQRLSQFFGKTFCGMRDKNSVLDYLISDLESTPCPITKVQMVENAVAANSIDDGCQADQVLPLTDTLSLVVTADRTNLPLVGFAVDHDVPCQKEGFYREVPDFQSKIEVELNNYCDKPGTGFIEVIDLGITELGWQE